MIDFLRNCMDDFLLCPFFAVILTFFFYRLLDILGIQYAKEKEMRVFLLITSLFIFITIVSTFLYLN